MNQASPFVMLQYFQIILWLATWSSLGFSEAPIIRDPTSFQEPFVNVTEIRFSGLNKTDPTWVREYLNITPPIKMTRRDGLNAARKLMTTGVFSDVKANFRTPSTHSSKKYDSAILDIIVEEKWTTIPVIRGAFGGGTPLRVLGAYDTHVDGRLFTFGGEFRKYGDAPPGFVTYFRNPRADQGRQYHGLELWNDRRIRDLYNKEREIAGHLTTHSQKIKARFLSQPFSDSQWLVTSNFSRSASQFFLGLELKGIRIFPSTASFNMDVAKDQETGIYQREENNSAYFDFSPSLVIDSLESSLLELEGYRLRYQFGPSLLDKKLGSTQELELFIYDMLPYDFNGACHIFAKNNSHSTTATDHFLGGFDSVRSFPDGFRFGPSTYFANIELRKIIFRSKYLWIQSLGFFDAGNAASQWQSLASIKPLSSAGFGVRFAIPQVYRLMLRIDYAWSLIDRSQGLSGGMNQFFDPFTPL